jgi:hypothetical protein
MEAQREGHRSCQVVKAKLSWKQGPPDSGWASPQGLCKVQQDMKTEGLPFYLAPPQERGQNRGECGLVSSRLCCTVCIPGPPGGNTRDLAGVLASPPAVVFRGQPGETPETRRARHQKEERLRPLDEGMLDSNHVTTLIPGMYQGPLGQTSNAQRNTGRESKGEDATGPHPRSRKVRCRDGI